MERLIVAELLWSTDDEEKAMTVRHSRTGGFVRLVTALVALVLVAVAGAPPPAGADPGAALTVAANFSLTISPIDVSGSSGGSGAAMAIGADGLPTVGYAFGSGLRVVHCQDRACTRFAGNNIDTGGGGPRFISLKIGSDGNPVLVFVDTICCTFDRIHFVHCEDTLCTRTTLRTFASEEDGLSPPAVTIGSDGLPLVSYEDVPDFGQHVFNVAHCLRLDCSSVRSSRIAQTSNRGGADSSITIGRNGLAIIAYHIPHALKVTACGNPDCSASNTTTTIEEIFPTPGRDTGLSPSIAVGTDGNPLVSYTGDVSDSASTLKVAHCTNPVCTARTVTVADSGGRTGGYPSVAIGSDGLGIVSFHNLVSKSLQVVHCTDVVCSNTNVRTTLDDGGVGSSIATGRDGLPVIAYPGLVSGREIHVAHCGDLVCSVPDFGMGLTRESGSVVAGRSATTRVTLTPINGFTGSADVTASGLPAGVTAAFAPSSVSADAPATLTLSSSASSPLGTFAIGVTATATGRVAPAHTINYQLTITSAAPSFSIETIPARGTMEIPNPVTTDVFLNPVNGFSGAATLSASGLPVGVTASFSSPRISADGPVQMTLSSEDSADGTFKVTIAATAADGTTRFTSFALTIAHIVN